MAEVKMDASEEVTDLNTSSPRPSDSEVEMDPVEMDPVLSELEEDIKELKLFHDQSQRPRVKELLQNDIKKLEMEASTPPVDSPVAEAASLPEPSPALPAEKKLPLKIVDTYAWDQSDKFMKIYITLNDVHKLKKESIKSEFTKRSFKARVEELNGRNHELKVVHLFGNIIPEESYHKVKTNMVTIFMKKAEQKKTWAYVTENEQKLKNMKEHSSPKLDSQDPNEGLMQLMKKMYDEGDDEMKKTINKAWCESQEKRNAGGDLGIPPL